MEVNTSPDVTDKKRIMSDNSAQMKHDTTAHGFYQLHQSPFISVSPEFPRLHNRHPEGIRPEASNRLTFSSTAFRHYATACDPWNASRTRPFSTRRRRLRHPVDVTGRQPPRSDRFVCRSTDGYPRPSNRTSIRPDSIDTGSDSCGPNRRRGVV